MLVACLAISACSDVYDVSYDYDEQFPISSVQTFGWLPLTKKNRSRMDEITHSRIQTAIAADLEGKGLVGPAEDPDILIEVIFGAKGGSRRTGRRGRYRYKEGYLNIDFVDPRSNNLVWHGEARAVLAQEHTPEESKAIIDEVVGKILRNYPPDGSG